MHKSEDCSDAPIYVASSWKNDPFLDLVHSELFAAGFSTLDFRDQGRWHLNAGPRDDVYGHLHVPAGKTAFEFDLSLMKRAKACLVVLPAGTAVALEVGWFVGRGIPVIVWGEPREPLDITWRLVLESNGGLWPRYSLEAGIGALKVALRDRYQKFRPTSSSRW